MKLIHQKITYVILIIVFLFLIKSFINAYTIEKNILQVQIGMNKDYITSLLGNSEITSVSPVCEKCPEKREQLFYRGNPSLWYWHFEDNIVVCYKNNVVCDFTRMWL